MCHTSAPSSPVLLWILLSVSPFCLFVSLLYYSSIMMPDEPSRHEHGKDDCHLTPLGTALMVVTCLAAGDSRLSALVNSHSCEGQELTYNEARLCYRARQRSRVNSGCSIMSAAVGWAFSPNQGGNLSTAALIPGPWLPIDTYQSMDTEQINISQYALPPPASWHSHPSAAMFTSPPVKTIETMAIMMKNVWVVRGCF